MTVYCYYLCFSLFVILSHSDTLVQLTDIHYDPDYHVGAPDHCFSDLFNMRCCHTVDIPRHPYQNASVWGNHNCNTPPVLVEASLRWISRVIQPNVILYTGDSVDHQAYSQSITKNMHAVRSVAQLFQRIFPDIPVLSTHGNHDTFPVDQTLPYVYPYMLKNMGAYWAHWMTPKSLHQYQSNGYYSQNVFARLDVVSFNSIPYNTHNMFGSHDLKANQWRWLNATLHTSVKNERSVWFMSHYPPHSSSQTSAFRDTLNRHIRPYIQHIKGFFFGHTHRDECKMMYDTWVAQISPSLMPTQKGACFRTYEYNQTTHTLNDYSLYCADITKDHLTFRKVFSYCDMYNGVGDACGLTCKAV